VNVDHLKLGVGSLRTEAPLTRELCSFLEVHGLSRNQRGI
jgi:hypothetical protein